MTFRSWRWAVLWAALFLAPSIANANLLSLGAGLGSAAPSLGDTFYVDDTGTDSGTCGIGAPCATLNYVHSLAGLGAGDTVKLNPGVDGAYDITAGTQWTKDGTSGSRITIEGTDCADPPHISGANIGSGTYGGTSDGYPTSTNAKGSLLNLWNVNYVTVSCIEFSEFPTYGVHIQGTDGVGSRGITLSRLNIHHGGFGTLFEGKGIACYGELGITDSILIENNDSHHNQDLNQDNADGIQCNPYLGGGNPAVIIRYNRFYCNSEDGTDFFQTADGLPQDPMLIEGNWAFSNGYDPADCVTVSSGGVGGDGFKLGGDQGGSTSGGHIVRYNLSIDNALAGFDQNAASIPMEVYNNTAAGNNVRLVAGYGNYYFGDPATSPGHEISNNISRHPIGALDADIDSTSTATTNSWQIDILQEDSDYASIDATALDDPREADGSLPVITYLHLVDGSDLVDRGTDVGQVFNSTAPDLGAYESVFSYSPPAGPTYIREMWVASQGAEVTTISPHTLWSNCVSKVISHDASTRYFIVGGGDFNNGSTTSDVKWRIFDGAVAIDTWNIEPKDTVPAEYLSQAALVDWTAPASSGTTMFTLQVASEASAVVSKCRNARLWIVEEIAGDEFIETTADLAPDENETTAQTLTWTPASTKDYLIIGSATLGAAGLPNTTTFRLNNGAGTKVSENYSQANDAAMRGGELVIDWAPGLTAVSQTFTLRALASSVTLLAHVSDRALLALDLTGAACYENTIADGSASTSSTFADSLTHSPTIAATKDHVTITTGGMLSASATVTALMRTLVDGVEVSQQAREGSVSNSTQGYSSLSVQELAAGARNIKVQPANEDNAMSVTPKQIKAIECQIES